MARGLSPSIEIAITRSTALSADSSVGTRLGTTVLSAEGENGDGTGETCAGTVLPEGGVA